ncbi:hypothetical protein ACHAQH_007375 [Verticillium albo-atrum]
MFDVELLTAIEDTSEDDVKNEADPSVLDIDSGILELVVLDVMVSEDMALARDEVVDIGVKIISEDKVISREDREDGIFDDKGGVAMLGVASSDAKLVVMTVSVDEMFELELSDAAKLDAKISDDAVVEGIGGPELPGVVGSDDAISEPELKLSDKLPSVLEASVVELADATLSEKVNVELTNVDVTIERVPGLITEEVSEVLVLSSVEGETIALLSPILVREVSVGAVCDIDSLLTMFELKSKVKVELPERLSNTVEIPLSLDSADLVVVDPITLLGSKDDGEPLGLLDTSDDDTGVLFSVTDGETAA